MSNHEALKNACTVADRAFRAAVKRGVKVDALISALVCVEDACADDDLSGAIRGEALKCNPGTALENLKVLRADLAVEIDRLETEVGDAEAAYNAAPEEAA